MPKRNRSRSRWRCARPWKRGKDRGFGHADRALGRRVLAALKRWNIEAEDSSGGALVDTPTGTFARLAAEVALGGLAPVPLLALIKHPLLRPRSGAGERAITALERAVLRGPRPRAGSAALGHALTAFRNELKKLRDGEPSDLHPSDPRAALTDTELAAAADFVAWLAARACAARERRRRIAPLQRTRSPPPRRRRRFVDAGWH